MRGIQNPAWVQCLFHSPMQRAHFARHRQRPPRFLCQANAVFARDDAAPIAFGQQVEDYACVYTSRVSNFLAYSPLRYFRSPRDHMPHELV